MEDTSGLNVAGELETASSEKAPWSGGWIAILLSIATGAAIASAEVFLFGGWILANFSPMEDDGTPIVEDATVLVATIVVTGMIIAATGSIMRVLAHNRPERIFKNIDLVGKMCALTAIIFALVGATQFLSNQVREAAQLIMGLVLALLIIFLWVHRTMTRHTRRSRERSATASRDS